MAGAPAGTIVVGNGNTPIDPPDPGQTFLYVKNDGLLYRMDSGGIESLVGGSVVLWEPWTLDLPDIVLSGPGSADVVINSAAEPFYWRRESVLGGNTLLTVYGRFIVSLLAGGSGGVVTAHIDPSAGANPPGAFVTGLEGIGTCTVRQPYGQPGFSASNNPPRWINVPPTSIEQVFEFVTTIPSGFPVSMTVAFSLAVIIPPQ